MDRERVLEVIDQRMNEVTSQERLDELRVVRERVDEAWFNVDDEVVEEALTLLRAFVDSEECLSAGQLYRVLGLDSREEAERVLAELGRRGEAVESGDGWRPVVE